MYIRRYRDKIYVVSYCKKCELRYICLFDHCKCTAIIHIIHEGYTIERPRIKIGIYNKEIYSLIWNTLNNYLRNKDTS